MSLLQFRFSEVYFDGSAGSVHPDFDIGAVHFTVEVAGCVVQSLPHMPIVELSGNLSEWLADQSQRRATDYAYSSGSTDEIGWFGFVRNDGGYKLYTYGEPVPDVPLVSLTDMGEAIEAFRTAVVSDVRSQLNLDVSVEASARHRGAFARLTRRYW